VPRFAVLGIFVLVAVAHTWPLAQRPAVHSRVDNGDYSLNVWAVDWVARTLPTDPAHLFDANIFYPSRLTLAYSEPLILQGALAMPAVWLGMSPVTTFNLLLIAGFALSGWAFALLVQRDTGSWLAGLVAGSAVAFNAHHLVRLAHIQALHLELVPLVFLALDRLLVTRRVWYAALLGAALALQATTSIYLLVFTGWALICAGLVRLPEWRRRVRETALWMLVAGATCVLLLLPILWPYAELARTQGMTRDVGEARRCAATWTDYLYTGSRVHFDAWSNRFQNDSSDANFPGLTVTGLAVFALLGAGRRSPRARMWLGVVLGSVLLSALPRLPGFEWLHEHVPAMGALRCYSRAGQMALVGMAVLAGYGAARLMRALDVRSRPGPGTGGNDAAALDGPTNENTGQYPGEEQSSGAERHAGRIPRSLAIGPLRTARAAMVVGFALLAAINLEALRAPFWYRDFSGIPAIYNRLRDEPHAIVVEMPFYDRRAFFGNAEYMINATRHRHPIVNGYSGFAPPDFDVRAEALRAFPGDAALQMMHQLGVTHVVVHSTRAMEQRRAAIDATSALRLVVEEDGIAIYRFVHH
jgi:hypothetical protein